MHLRFMRPATGAGFEALATGARVRESALG